MSAAAAPRALHAELGYCDATATASASRRRRSRRLQCCAAYLPFSTDTLCCARRTLERLGYSGKAFLHDFSIRVIGVMTSRSALSVSSTIGIRYSTSATGNATVRAAIAEARHADGASTSVAVDEPKVYNVFFHIPARARVPEGHPRACYVY